MHLKRRKKSQALLVSKEVQTIVQKELEPYATNEDVKEYLAKIESDEKKKKIWDSLTPLKKVKLLRYVIAKRGVAHGKG